MAWGTPCHDNHLFQLNPPHLSSRPKMSMHMCHPLRDCGRKRDTYLHLNWECWPKYHILTMCILRSTHIRKNVTQLVPTLVWRKVYEGFWKEFLNIAYQEETLKENREMH